jgi:hypothetical protein
MAFGRLTFVLASTPKGRKAFFLNWKRPIRALVTATALLAVLLFATSVGEACEAWQHHECSANPNCPICHLDQQVVEWAAQGQCIAIPQRLGVAFSPPEPSFAPSLRTPLLITRAPPHF